VLVQVSRWAWLVFGILVVSALAVDLGDSLTARGRERVVSLRSAVTRSVLWILLSLGFAVGVWAIYGRQAAVTYLTAYLLEKSLSVDNIFVFVLIFSYLRIPAPQQRGVLLWGVLGALGLRALLIAAGLFALERFHWVVYPFAVLIIVAAIRLVWGQQQEQKAVAAACSVCSTWVARLIPITPQLHGRQFVVWEGGRLVATPLFVALVVIETTDIVFALDSVPAVLAITRVPFLVYTSNIFAMLGLRALYFVVADVVERLRFLRVGLAVILVFVGAKLLLSDVIELPSEVSLAVIAVALSVSVFASIRFPATKAASG
jgi:tellurite resistance protein TerC